MSGDDFSGVAPVPPARWKIGLVRAVARATPAPARRRLLQAKRAAQRAVRRRAESRGDRSRSDPSLYGIAASLDRWLGDRRDCFFVEAGANDGFTQSNTYHLERFRGWRGVLVEPVPELHREAVVERPGSRVVNCALVPFGHPEPTVRIRYGDLMSVVAGTHGSEEADRAHVEPAFLLGLEERYEVDVPARTLSDVLDEAGAPAIDFMSLDVEGFEPQVLRGLDLDRHAPALLLVEALDDAARERIDEVLGDRYGPPTRISPFDWLYERS